VQHKDLADPVDGESPAVIRARAEAVQYRRLDRKVI